jgi:hypothetical protein
MHRTSRRQARQDRGCRNVPRGHDGQTQQTGYPASYHPTHRTRFWLGSRSDCQRPWQVRCSADRDLPESPPGHPLSRSRRLERKELLSRAGERPNAAPRAGPSAIGWSTQRIVSSPAMCPARAPTIATNRPLLPSEPIPASARAVPHRHVSRPWLVASELPHEVGQLLAELGFAGSVDAEPTTLRADPGLAMTVRPSSYRHRGVVPPFPARSGIRIWWG